MVHCLCRKVEGLRCDRKLARVQLVGEDARDVDFGMTACFTHYVCEY